MIIMLMKTMIFLEKFDEDIKKNFILENHKECLNKNFEEIKELLKIKKIKIILLLMNYIKLCQS